MFDWFLDYLGLETSDTFTIHNYVAVMGSCIMFLLIILFYIYKIKIGLPTKEIIKIENYYKLGKINAKDKKQMIADIYATIKLAKIFIAMPILFFIYTFFHSISLIVSLKRRS